MFNAGRPKAYRIGTLGDATLGSVTKSAYEIAKAQGNPHHGWLWQQRKLKTVTLKKSIRTLRKQIVRHAAWIADPYLKFPADADKDEVRYHQHRKWPNDIARQREHIEILEGVIGERDYEE